MDAKYKRFKKNFVINVRNFERLKLLLNFGTDINAMNINGEIALFHAIRFGNIKIA